MGANMANIEKRTTQEGKTSYRVKVRLKGYPVQTATLQRRTQQRRNERPKRPATRGKGMNTATLFPPLQWPLDACRRGLRQSLAGEAYSCGMDVTATGIPIAYGRGLGLRKT
jgi:hypothetical protein